MKIKTYLFFIAILGLAGKAFTQCDPSAVFYDQLDVAINFNQSHLNVSGLLCDFCIYGAEGRSICECRKSCSLNDQQNNFFIECIDDCEDKYYDDPVYLDYCLDACENYKESILNECKNECGELPLEQREVVSYSVQVLIWYNTGWTETMDGSEDVRAGTPLIIGQPPNTVTVNLNHQFPNQPISYCYLVLTVLFYDDQTCCVYVDDNCFNLG